MRSLRWLLLLYCFASLVHFVHNAEFLTDYPNLPTWLTRAQVYTVWVGITAIGVVGYALTRSGYPRAGLSLLTVYAVLGLDGLAHYTRAPFAVHTAAMNFTILFEVGAAIAVLVSIVGTHRPTRAGGRSERAASVKSVDRAGTERRQLRPFRKLEQ